MFSCFRLNEMSVYVACSGCVLMAQFKNKHGEVMERKAMALEQCPKALSVVLYEKTWQGDIIAGCSLGIFLQCTVGTNPHRQQNVCHLLV